MPVNDDSTVSGELMPEPTKAHFRKNFEINKKRNVTSIKVIEEEENEMSPTKRRKRPLYEESSTDDK